ncbi:MAG: hydrogenase nickel incorporation protein HypA [Desulfobacterota bacterium]|nr:hydrogenase nickel incorporation protein HypA [Thermodesulfobacteriota bacterium]MDW8001526.1 hydrogenase nickel incorporation protein HypA [Deltaproteobacteria bacterium]
MHEWAVAESIVLTVLKEAEKNGMRFLDRIVLRIGELQRMEKDILCFAMESIFRHYGYELSEKNFDILEEPAFFKCHVCETEWPYVEVLRSMGEEEKEFIHFIPEVAHGFIKCPSCGSSDFELERGRGVVIESISGRIC